MTTPVSSPVDRLWLTLSSLRTTAVLTTVLALLAGVAAVVPQGRDALLLLTGEHSEGLRRLAALGLTDVFQSGWMRALAVLLFANVLAALVRGFRGGRSDGPAAPPKGAPLVTELVASLPERAVEALRLNLRSALGAAPSGEQVEGAKVTLVFDTHPKSQLTPLLSHVGLILVVVGAGLLMQPPPESRSLVRALLRVTDSRTGSVGHFDMAQGEPVKFFQWRAEYVLRDYRATTSAGLGPAVRVERISPQDQRRDDFWVYRDAPAGFDQRHRRGLVAIEALSMGFYAAPGFGMSSNPASFLLLLGMGLAVLGAVGARRAAGRVWVEADGERVRLVGVPAVAADQAFGRVFERLSLISKLAIEG